MAEQEEDEIGDFTELEGKTRGEIIRYIALAGLDKRLRFNEVRERLKEEQDWKVTERDLKDLREMDPSFASEVKSLVLSLSQRAITKTEFKKQLVDMIFKQNFKMMERVKADPRHTARPLLNILSEGTEIAETLRSKKVVLIDDVVAVGRTSVMGEILFRAFYDQAQVVFFSVRGKEKYAKVYDAFATRNLFCPENNPELVDILGHEVESPSIPSLKAVRMEEVLAKLEEEYKRQFTGTYSLDVLLANDYTSPGRLKVYEDKLRRLIDNRFKKYQTVLDSEEIIAIIKLYFRDDWVSRVFVNDFLAPHTFNNIAYSRYKKAVKSVLNDLAMMSGEQIEELRTLDEKIRGYDEINILQRFLKAIARYKVKAEESVKVLESDEVLRSMVLDYLNLPHPSYQAHFAPLRSEIYDSLEKIVEIHKEIEIAA
jgi:hypothetical protein